jgi:hypothetical protein
MSSWYEGESVNTSQMDIKRNTRDVRTWKKIISRHILHQHWYTCPIALPVRRNPSVLTAVSATSTPPSRTLHQRNVCNPDVNRFTRQTLPTANWKHFFMKILITESFCPQNTHNRTLFFVSTFKQGRHFDYWNQPMNMRVCYLDCHEAGLRCYLVIQKTYYVHYSCFTCVCDQFTDSPSYIFTAHKARWGLQRVRILWDSNPDTSVVQPIA